jgi:hypothetical protein
MTPATISTTIMKSLNWSSSLRARWRGARSASWFGPCSRRRRVASAADRPLAASTLSAAQADAAPRACHVV